MAILAAIGGIVVAAFIGLGVVTYFAPQKTTKTRKKK